MRIESDSLALQSNNTAFTSYEKTEELTLGRIQRDADGNQKLIGIHFTNNQSQTRNFLANYEDLSDSFATTLEDAAKKAAKEIKSQSTQAANPLDSSTFTNDERMGIMLLLELLSRFKNDPDVLKALGVDEDSLKNGGSNSSLFDMLKAAGGTGAVAGARASATTMEYHVSETFYQSETAEFNAAGQVKTADGKTIDVNLNLKMNRELLENKDFSMKLQAATRDPLVVNFDGTAAQLSSNRFSFDLTGDGAKESIPQLLGNSAFLALDRNQDGTINDGSELFGTQSGDGFADLAQYDEDNNGWIDENDEVFNNLKLWIDAGSDDQKLMGLKDAGIGALYTGKAATEFHLQDSTNSKENLGIVRATGLYLHENGEAGTMQQLDLTI